mmetsp:Transcript_1626/g.2971  ORF Transcript_1626/g.2971 Transcript_1626/m.2971 type:complete len:246 (-) Transcript_1626:311-1048(-)
MLTITQRRPLSLLASFPLPQCLQGAATLSSQRILLSWAPSVCSIVSTVVLLPRNLGMLLALHLVHLQQPHLEPHTFTLDSFKPILQTITFTVTLPLLPGTLSLRSSWVFLEWTMQQRRHLWQTSPVTLVISTNCVVTQLANVPKTQHLGLLVILAVAMRLVVKRSKARCLPSHHQIMMITLCFPTTNAAPPLSHLPPSTFAVRLRQEFTRRSPRCGQWVATTQIWVLTTPKKRPWNGIPMKSKTR